jgi:hypothetical protein
LWPPCPPVIASAAPERQICARPLAHRQRLGAAPDSIWRPAQSAVRSRSATGAVPRFLRKYPPWSPVGLLARSVAPRQIGMIRAAQPKALLVPGRASLPTLSFARIMGPGRCHDLGTTLWLLCHLGVCGGIRRACGERPRRGVPVLTSVASTGVSGLTAARPATAQPPSFPPGFRPGRACNVLSVQWDVTMGPR